MLNLDGFWLYESQVMKDSTKYTMFSNKMVVLGRFEGVPQPRALWERSTCLHGRDIVSWEDMPGLDPLAKLLDPGHVPDGHL